MGKNIFFTGLVILLVGIFAFAAKEPIQTFITSFSQKEAIQVSENISKNTPENSSKTQKIPQKISGSLEAVKGEFYVNFTCPHCRNFYKNSLAPLKKEYEQEMKIEIKNYPFLNTGLEMEVAKFFVCATEQKEQFFVLDYFFFGMDEISELKNEEWTEGLGLDPEKMTACLETAEEKVLAEKKQGQKLRVRGAPTFFLDTKKISENSEKFEGNVEKYQLEMKLLPLIK